MRGEGCIGEGRERRESWEGTEGWFNECMITVMSDLYNMKLRDDISCHQSHGLSFDFMSFE